MKRRYRLRRNSDFQRVRQRGKNYASPLMVLAFLQNDLEYSRFGFVVNKRIGKAVHRNKIKRRMREATRLRIPRLKPGFDFVIIARKPIRRATYQQIEETLEYLFNKNDMFLS